MKNILIIILSIFSLNAFSQTAGRLQTNQAKPILMSAPNIVWVDRADTTINRMWVAEIDSLKIKWHQEKWLSDTIKNRLTPYMKTQDTTAKWRGVTWVPSWSQVTSKPSFALVATSGSYTDLTNKPAFPGQVNSDWSSSSGASQILNKPTNVSVFTNNAGYLTSVPAQSFASITGKPTTLSGYGLTDAYPLSGNPSGFLTSYTETDPLFNTKLASKSTTDIAEGSNQYWTSSRFNTAFSAKTTTDLTEGTNQYFTTARARSAWTLTTSGTGAATYVSGVLNIPTPATISPTFNNAVSRSLNSNFTISSTQVSHVAYTVRISYNITVLLGSTGSVSLQYSMNGGTTFSTVSTISNSLNLGLALTGYNDFVLSGEIPANALVRLNSTSTNATNSITLAQEVLE